jgi:hypothetical protein
MRFPCAGCGALDVASDEVFCKGCNWSISQSDRREERTQIYTRLQKVLNFPTFTTNPHTYFERREYVRST